MLHPRKNRIDYGEQLIPPDGYELARAIATTYCLDLEALMLLPVALFYAKTLDGKPDELRYDMLEGITKAAEKITVFYHNTQLKVPQKYHHLMAYWEKGVQPITMPNHASSFHPKVWVARYTAQGKPAKYRLLVTSRNITFARDWDVAFSTDGEVTETDQPRNRPLIDFLGYLSDHGRAIEPDFISELERVKFDLPDKFFQLRFIPVGIPNESGKTYVNPITTGKLQWEELLIMSPFLDNKTLTTIGECCSKEPFLLSTKNELDSVDSDVLERFSCFQFSSRIEEGEKRAELEGEGETAITQNLHAKLFIGRNDDKLSWYLGSANCTAPAQERNVEFMVALTAEVSSGMKPRDILNMLKDQDEFAIFEAYDYDLRVGTVEQKRVDLEIRKIKYDLCRAKIRGEVPQVEAGTAYNLIIVVDFSATLWPEEYQITIRPLPEQLKAPIALEQGLVNTITDFGNYAETLLSPFVQLEISYKGIVQSQFLVPMEIDLPQTRLNRIFTSIIDSKEKFLKYLVFLLTGEETSIIERTAMRPGNSILQERLGFVGMPVFEKLLVNASRNPGRLDAIDRLITQLKMESAEDKEPIITPEFESLWSVFQSFMKQHV